MWWRTAVWYDCHWDDWLSPLDDNNLSSSSPKVDVMLYGDWNGLDIYTDKTVINPLFVLSNLHFWLSRKYDCMLTCWANCSWLIWQIQVAELSFVFTRNKNKESICHWSEWMTHGGVTPPGVLCISTLHGMLALSESSQHFMDQYPLEDREWIMFGHYPCWMSVSFPINTLSFSN